MKKLTLLIIKLIFGVSAFAQMDDFYSDTPFDMYLTKNNVRYVFDNDSINQAISPYLPGKNYWTIGFRAQGHGDRFHWAYRNELPELLLGFATNFLSKGKINKDLDNMTSDNLIGGFYVGEFNGAWNIVNKNNTKFALGFNLGDFIADGHNNGIAKHLLGMGIHSIFEQKLTDKFALRGIYTLGITGRMNPDPLQEYDWLPIYRRATIELLTDFGMYLAVEHLKFSAPEYLYYQRRIDFKIGLRI